MTKRAFLLQFSQMTAKPLMIIYFNIDNYYVLGCGFV